MLTAWWVAVRGGQILARSVIIVVDLRFLGADAPQRGSQEALQALVRGLLVIG